MIANDFLSIRDFSPQQIEHVLDVACHVKADPAAYSTALKGKTLAMIFEKPSLRARVTFEVGIHQLGGFALCLSPAEIQLGKRESIYDLAKHLERVVQAIMISTFAHEIVEEMADYADIPVITGLTDYSDPCQAMADYLTMLELKGRVRGLKVAFVGDGNNVAHSLMFAGAQLGAQVTVATPAGYEPCQAAARWARLRARETGGSCAVVVDPFEAVAGADVVYTDAWTGTDREVESPVRGQAFALYQVNAELMSRARPEAVFMHSLPAHRGLEVADEVIDSLQSVVFQQAENRLHVQKAIMIELMKDVAVEHDRVVREAVVSQEWQ